MFPKWWSWSAKRLSECDCGDDEQPPPHAARTSCLAICLLVIARQSFICLEAKQLCPLRCYSAVIAVSVSMSLYPGSWHHWDESREDSVLIVWYGYVVLYIICMYRVQLIYVWGSFQLPSNSVASMWMLSLFRFPFAFANRTFIAKVKSTWPKQQRRKRRQRKLPPHPVKTKVRGNKKEWT